MKNRLTGQTAIVTGSSSGIGKAILIAMGKEGANVVINYRSDKDGAEETQKELRKQAPDVKSIMVRADVSSEDDIIRLFESTKEEFGTFDICVPNAGIQLDHPLHEMPLKDWKKVLDVNLTGQFLCARESLKEFLRRGIREEISKASGKLIHVSSVHDVIPWAGHANYAASKGGLMMLMQSICQAYAKEGVRCNSLSPGATKTDINKEAWDNQDSLNKILQLIPQNRMGEPKDMGEVAVWLASDESDYVNGTTIYVDGGMTCYPGFATNG